MKIQIISYHYPPDETVASRRLLRIASSFLRSGHSVNIHKYSPAFFRTNSSQNSDSEKALKIYNHGEKIVNYLYKIRNKKQNDKPIIRTNSNKQKNSLEKNIIPDWQIIALPFMLMAEIIRIVRNGRVEVTLASGPLFSAFMIGYIFSYINKSKLILDYRDPWTDSDYRLAKKNSTSISSYIENKLEKKIIKSADLVVTVSEGLKILLEEKGAKNIKVAYNSLSEQELNITPPPIIPIWLKNNKFKILYSGSLYSGRRDPSLFFDSCSKLDKKSRSNLQIIFLGKDSHLVKDIISQYNLDDIEIITDNVSYNTSRFVQTQVDLLLLLNWKESNKQDYIVTAKVFEYISSKKPILSIGSTRESELLKIISSSGLGSFIEEDEISSFISKLIENRYKKNQYTEIILPSVESIPNWIT